MKEKYRLRGSLRCRLYQPRHFTCATGVVGIERWQPITGQMPQPTGGHLAAFGVVDAEEKHGGPTVACRCGLELTSRSYNELRGW